MSILCKHNFVESTKDEKVIYCTKCGDMRVLPCAHLWSLTRTVSVFDEPSDRMPDHHVYIYTCEKCGMTRKDKSRQTGSKDK